MTKDQEVLVYKSISVMRMRFCVAAILSALLALQGCKEAPEAKYNRFLQNGKTLMEKKDPARALLQFRNALQVKPNEPEAVFQVALAYLALGDYRQGVVALRKTLLLNPKHSGAQLEFSRLMVSTNNRDLITEARKDLQELLADGQSNPDALQVLALSELKLGSPEEAAQHLERALATAPQNLLVAVTLAQAKLSQNDPKGAEEALKTAEASMPQSADAAVMLGRFYLGFKRYGEAEEQFRRAYRLDAKNGTALLNLAILQNGTGKKADAEQTLRQLAAFPDPDSKGFLGIFLFQVGRQDEALKQFEAIVKAFPDDRPARTRLVSAYNSMNRVADAQKLLDAVLKKNPKDSDALVQRAELLLASRKFEQAEGDLNQVLRQQPNSAEVHYIMARLWQAQGSELRYRQELTAALNLNPYLEPVRIDLARLLISMKQGGAALELVNQAPGSQRDSLAMLAYRNWANWTLGDMAAMRKGINQGLAVRRSTEFLIQDGMWKLKSGDPASARKAIEEALKIDSSDLRALQTLQQTYIAQKNGPLALEKVKEYAARQPNSAPVQEFLGMLLMANGDHQQARTAFETAKKADPKSLKAQLSLVQTDVLDSRWDDAQRGLEAILSADPANLTARLWLGNIEVTKGDNKAALEQFRQVVTSDPNNPEALNNFAYLLAEYGNQPNEALKYAQKAKELAPEAAEYSDTLGWILYRKGLYKLAVAELEFATSKNGNAVSKYHLAMAYGKAGDLNRGRAVLQTALKANPRLPEAGMAREVLEAHASDAGRKQ
jgi:tetratricopeptide (TPR) repeat protein